MSFLASASTSNCCAWVYSPDLERVLGRISALEIGLRMGSAVHIRPVAVPPVDCCEPPLTFTRHRRIVEVSLTDCQCGRALDGPG